MTALIEEAVSIGDLVRIFEFQQGRASMVEITLPEGSPFAGRRVGDVDWPTDTVLVAIIREERPLAPTPDDAIEAGDELLFITTTEQEDRLQDLVAPGERHHADQRGLSPPDRTGPAGPEAVRPRGWGRSGCDRGAGWPPSP